MSKVLYTSEQIATRLTELANQVAHDYQGRSLLLVGVLKGAFILTADVVRTLYVVGFTDVEVSFLILKSYRTSTTTSGEITLAADTDINPKGKHVLIIDDIFDSGKSFEFVDKHMRMQHAASVEGFALLAKPERHQVVYRPKYIGFSVPKVWTEGYGMDSAEKGRGNPAIIAKDE